MSQAELPVSMETKPQELIARIKDLREEKREHRRNFLKTVGIAGAALAGGAMLAKDAHAQRGAVDPLVLNFALNLEYLEGEYYTLATQGKTLSQIGVGTNGVGTTGTVTVKANPQVRFSLADVQAYANEIALDEQNHVVFLRTALGGSAVAEPNIDLLNSFNTAAQAAGIGTAFDPFGSSTTTSIVNDLSFLLGAFVFEDVGVTAYKGGSVLLTNKAYLEAAAGILAVEAYHAGEVRTFLYANRTTIVPGTTGNQTVAEVVQRISDLRDSVDNQDGSGTAGDDRDQGITSNQTPSTASTGTANIVPADGNSIAYSRNTSSVLKIVYLGGPLGTGGGFFPNGMNGAIR